MLVLMMMSSTITYDFVLDNVESVDSLEGILSRGWLILVVFKSRVMMDDDMVSIMMDHILF